MISSPDYRTATNMAYATLCSLHISELPIALSPAIKRFQNLRLIPYSKLCDRQRISWSEFMETNVSERGYIYREDNRAAIFYNDRIDPEITRFTIAHEFGHYILGHTEDTPATDREANCFARNFLCPVPVTDYWKLKNINECCDIFDITPPAAQVVLDKKYLDRINTDTNLYRDTAQLLGLPTLTKEAQLTHRSSRAARAFIDFSIGWSDEIGSFNRTAERLRI